MKRIKGRLTMTVLLSVLVFLVLFLALLLGGAAVFLLVRTGVLSTPPKMYYAVFYMAGASLLIGAVLAAVLSRFALQPIRALVAQMQRLASGDLQARLELREPYARMPAFAQISDGFNKMAQELQNTEMLRSDFINNFSHEFKTPIVSIAGFAKLLKRGNLSQRQREEYLDIIEEESLRLSDMATNVLNLTKVENQTILTGLSTFNLSEQLRASILLLERKWSKKDLQWQLEFGEYRITANEELLKQVWINLLDNAIKFSPEGGTVAVRITEQGGTLAVSVRNAGAAIPQPEQEKIFRKFYQVDESHSSEGNGIGLAIVKRVTELHRGTVAVRSGNDETTFTVTLPEHCEEGGKRI